MTSYVRLLALASSIQSFSSGSSIEFSADPIASITTRRPRLALRSYTSTKVSAVIALRAAVEIRRALSMFNFFYFPHPVEGLFQHAMGPARRGARGQNGNGRG